MKKIMLTLMAVVLTICFTFAEEAASCAFRSNPNAYVVASVDCQQKGNCCYNSVGGYDAGHAGYNIHVTSYGEKEGSVIVTITYETKNSGTNTLTKTIQFSNGKGSGFVKGECAASSNFRVNVSNAVCY